MGRHFLRVTMRYLMRQKMYTAINIVGLAIGLACCVMLLLFVRDEWRYDRHHEHRDRIYRVASSWRHNLTGVLEHNAKGPYPLAEALRREVPEIPHIVRFFPRQALVSHGPKRFFETRLFAADPNIFDVFTIPLLRGDPATVFDPPLAVVISSDMARKYFGQADPIGRKLRANDKIDFTVTGIFQPIPAHSHFHFDFLVSLSQIEPFMTTILRESWTEGAVFTYLLLPPTLSPAEVEQRLPSVVKKHMAPQIPFWVQM